MDFGPLVRLNFCGWRGKSRQLLPSLGSSCVSRRTSGGGEVYMIYPKTRVAALVMTIALAISGCSLFKSSSAPNDEAIVSSIQSKLYQDPVLKTRDIRVVS